MTKKFWHKSIQKVLAVTMTISMAVPSNVLYAEETGGQGYGDRSTSGQIELSADDIKNLYQRVSLDRQSVHDPSIIVNNSNGSTEYYVFGSHMGVAKTTDLQNWSSTSISDGSETNAYYGVRNANGTVTQVSYNNAFDSGAYGSTQITTADGSIVTVDFSQFSAAAWNTAVTTNPDANGSTSAWGITGNMWAPDIIYNENMGKWCMYLSLNGNVWNSVIILLTADSIEGPYVYEAPIIYSGFTSSGVTSYNKTDLSLVLNNGKALGSLPARYNNLITGVASDGTATSSNHGTYGTYWPNAIDPCVYYDKNGKLWMSYGSWSGGIYMIELDENTGLRDYTAVYDFKVNGVSASDTRANANVTEDPYFGKKIAGGYYVSGEGSYIQQIENYYYLFMSYGFYSPTGGYNMRIFRSEKPDGPYVDVNGQSAIYTSWIDNYRYNSRGLQLMGNYQWDTMSAAEIAQGHNSAFVDSDGNAYVIYHTKFDDGTAGHQLRIHQLYVNEDGWIVAAPYEYAGEAVNNEDIAGTAIPVEEIAGDYQMIVHQYSNTYAADNGTIENNVITAVPKDITLNKNGTITGAYTGTWSEKSGTAYATIVINGTEYKGVFTEQTIDDSNIKVLCFSAVSQSGVCIWGSKALEDDVIVAYNAKNGGSQIPSGTAGSLTLETAGEFGAEIAWSSSNKKLLSDTGKVSRPSQDAKVTLTKTVSSGKYYYQQDYTLTIYGTDSQNKDVKMSYDRAADQTELSGIKSITENTGVSISFTVSNITSDWTPVFTTANGEYVYLSVLNYGGQNIFEASASMSSAAVAAGYAPWSIFTDGGRHKVMISYNVDGSIGFYKDDVLMLTYDANIAIGSNTVADLSKAMAAAVQQGGLKVQYDMADINIGYALDYNGMDTSQYLYYQDYAEQGSSLEAVEFAAANTGVSLSFTVTGLTSDWTPIFITENQEYVYLSVLNYAGANTFEAEGILSSEALAAGYTSASAWTIFTDGNSHRATISYNIDGTIGFYRDGVLMLTYVADTIIGTGTAADLSREMALAVQQGKLTVQYDMADVGIGYGMDYKGKEYLYYQDYAGQGSSLAAAASVTVDTGVAISFVVTGITSDWTPIFITQNQEYVYLSVLNYAGANTFEAEGILSSAALAAGYTSASAWTIFTDGGTHKATISYNTDGTIGFYRDDVLMLTYAADTVIGTGTAADLSKAMALAVQQGKLTVRYNMENVGIKYALN